MKYLIILLMLVSCGSGGRIDVIEEDPDTLLFFDRFCTVRVKKTTLVRMSTGTRRLRIDDSEIRCRMLNMSKREYLGEVYNLEDVFEDGERLWILGDEGMEALYEYLIRNNLIEREE